MVGSLIIGCSKSATDYLYWASLGCRDLNVHRVFDQPPTLHYLIRLLNMYSPRIVFLEIGSSEPSLQIAQDIQTASPETSLIGFCENISADLLEKVSRVGIGEVLQTPFTEQAVQKAVGRALDSVRPGARHEITVFQPARGGSGSTTTALNVAWSLANHWRKKVLFIEADLHSGPVPIWFDLEAQHSIEDALEQSGSLDDAKWSAWVSSTNGLDLLLSSRFTRRLECSQWDCQRLLSFALARYENVIIDLPEVVEELFEPMLHRATRHYVVCRSDKVSLSMARRRLAELEERGADPTGLDVVLNGYARRQMKLKAIEGFLSRPVRVVLPDDKSAPQRAFAHHGLVTEGSSLGREYRAFAGSLVTGKGADESAQEMERGFLGKSISRWFGWSLGRVHS